MDTDFPAAHSMDTTWFAVDRDGHVGCFDSSEPGPVPASLTVGITGVELLEEIRQTGSTRPVVYDPAGWLVPGPAGTAEHHWMLEHPERSDRILVFFNSVAEAEMIRTAQTSTICQATNGIALVIEHPNQDLIQSLHVQRSCRSCWYYSESQATGDVALAAEVGLFGYEGLEYVDLHSSLWVPGPYGRKVLPQYPLHVDELPPEIRRTMLSVRFSKLCFAEASHIQPAEFTACESWADLAFLSGDGRHIVPRLPETEVYREVYQRLIELGVPTGISIQPPNGR